MPNCIGWTEAFQQNMAASGCSLAEIKRIREKGFFFHYSAFKRYKNYKANQKKSILALLDEYKRDMSIN